MQRNATTLYASNTSNPNTMNVYDNPQNSVTITINMLALL